MFLSCKPRPIYPRIRVQKHPLNSSLVATVKKTKASISFLLKIETRQFFPYTNYIIHLISSSSSVSWSRITGSQQCNIIWCVIVSTVGLAFIGLTASPVGPAFTEMISLQLPCDYMCITIYDPVCCTESVTNTTMCFSNGCFAALFQRCNPWARKL